MAVDTSRSYSYGLVPYATSGFNPALKPDYLPNVTAGQVTGVAAIISAYGASEAQKAAAINQQTSYMLQARDTLAVAEVRAEMSEQYATIQAGRTLKRAEMEAQNYTIAGNSLLKNMRATNAAMRARAAASGVVLGEGSVQAVQRENVAATMRDVGIADLNALTARVLGFEDASAMLQSTDYIGPRVAAQGASQLAQILDRMSANTFQAAAELRQQEGLEFAAQNPLTSEQVRYAKEGENPMGWFMGPDGKTGQIPTANSAGYFAKAVAKARSLELSGHFEIEGRNELTKLLAEVEAGKINSNCVARQLD